MFATLLALLAAGQAVAELPAKPSTLQQRFDAASDAAIAGRCAEAIAAFEAVEATGAPRRNPMLAAAVAVRKGGCLIRNDSVAEGEAAIRRGLPALIARQPDFAADLRDAYLALGLASETRFDYDGAAGDYHAAINLSKGAARVVPLLRLSQVTMFDHDGRAVAAAEEARALALAASQYGKKDIAALDTQYARVLLNEGRHQDAYRILRDSLAKQGGLGNKVGVADIATRSDLAIAALQNRDLDGARLYLAYTGAGRMHDTPFNHAAVMDPPVCGGEGGLTPDDEAIVEFTLAEDGHVAEAKPIYSTGRRAAALAFARAVADWSWRPEDAKQIPLLFRYTTRVEIRCIKSPEAPPLTRPLQEAADAWLAARIVSPPAWTDLSAAAALPVQQAALAKAQGAHDQAAILQAALALAGSPVTTSKYTSELLATATAAAVALDAPAPMRSYIALRQLEVAAQGDSADSYRRALRALLTKPEVAADPLGGATLRLLIARAMYRSGPPAEAKALLGAVIDAPALPANHPLKIAAMLSEANLLAAGGDLSAARAAFDRTGLTGEQCALIGLQPAVKHSGAGSNAYPTEALQLGFEGWVRAEYDIAPDGHTITPRVVTSYPPFVFDDAATGIVRGTRYTSNFRPDGALACSGQQQSIKFLMP